MSWTYPRNRKKIITYGGTWEPSDDLTQMLNNWVRAYPENPVASNRGIYWTVVASPGGVAGYSHKLAGKTGFTGGGGITKLYNHGGLSPFTGGHDNKQGTLPQHSYLQWKYLAEFRMYIVADESSTGFELRTGAGFGLDGVTDKGSQFDRIAVVFNVDSQKAGIVHAGFNPTPAYDYPLEHLEVAWSGSYNTWYDVRITWEYDFYNDPDTIIINVWVDNSPLITSYSYPKVRWLFADLSANPTSKYSAFKNSFMGRAGPVCSSIPATGIANDLPVEVYFKDILITIDDTITLQWQYNNSVVRTGGDTGALVFCRTEYSKALNKGLDFQTWVRNSTSDSWSNGFRGMIRQAETVRKRFVKLECEGYLAALSNERAENLTLTTKTTGEMIREAINNPSKDYINTTAYFDTTTTTYNRTYIQVPKPDMIAESLRLEGFVLWLDHGLNLHYQSPRTNDTGIHLVYGEDRITDHEIIDVFARKPNRIRIIGTGVHSERIIASELFSTNIYSYRNFNRPELTTQSEVDDYCDYIANLYTGSYKIIRISLRANYGLKTGHLVRLTYSLINIVNQRFFIAGIGNDNRKRMTIDLIDATADIALLLSDLDKRTGTNESERYPSDTVATTQLFQSEGIATLKIRAFFEVEYNSVIQRTDEMVITDGFIDDIIDKLNATAVTIPSHVAHGTGTTEPTFTDTALDTETARSAANKQDYRYSWDATTLPTSGDSLVHAVKYTVTISNPSAMTEIGLLNAASAGDLACRGTFSPYTQAGSVTLRVIIWMEPVPGATYITWLGIDNLCTWLRQDTFFDVDRMSHLAAHVETMPDPMQFRVISQFFDVAWTYWSNTVPDTGIGTLTKTVYKDRDMIHYKFVYAAFDSLNDNFGTANDRTAPETMLGLVEDFGDYFHLVSYLYSSIQSQEWDTFDCTWFIWLKIERGAVEE